MLRQAIIAQWSRYQTRNNINIYAPIFRFTLTYNNLIQRNIIGYYTIKFRVISRLLFNSSVIKIITKLRACGCGFKLKFNWTKGSRQYHTVLRSPVVYKKAQEQFYIRKLSGKLLIVIGASSSFSRSYLDFFLVKSVSTLKFDVGISLKRGLSLK